MKFSPRALSRQAKKTLPVLEVPKAYGGKHNSIEYVDEASAKLFGIPAGHYRIECKG